MSALSWSGCALVAPLAALPGVRASTAGESALAAAAWLLSGEEDRFSTRRSLAVGRAVLLHAPTSLRVRLARRALLVVALQRGSVGRIGAAQRAAALDLRADPGLQLLLLLGRLRHLCREVLWHAHHALVVAHHHVARVHRDLRAADP